MLEQFRKHAVIALLFWNRQCRIKQAHRKLESTENVKINMIIFLVKDHPIFASSEAFSNDYFCHYYLVNPALNKESGKKDGPCGCRGRSSRGSPGRVSAASSSAPAPPPPLVVVAARQYITVDE